MKKSTLFSSAMLAAMVMSQNANAALESTSTKVYDQTAWDNEQVLKLFSDAYDQGRNYPTQAQWESIGMGIEREFVRSHTRYRGVVKDASKDVVSDINHDRLLWANLPAGYGKQTGGYPQAAFDQDVFSMWNYVNLFGAWNYGFQMAPGCWIDAAHKNGTRMYGGIKFFESWSNAAEESAFKNFVTTKNSDGSFKYARAFVNCAAYFGNDGYNYNQEGSAWNDTDWVNFHKAVMDESRALNIEGFGIGQYTTNASLSTANVGKLYGTSEGKIFDCMLNYSGNKLYYSGVASSLTAAKSGPGVEGVYQGHLLVGLSSDYWTQMNQTAGTTNRKEMNLCIWGEHDQSRFFQFRIGIDPISTQENYQVLLEKAFSGANRNPLKRPAINNAWGTFQVSSAGAEQLANSPGFASMVPERTAINHNLPFQTHFSLGNGENYFYNGKVTHGAWYNMSQQDVVPTYRWRVTAKNNMSTYANDIDVRFSHEDAYVGGSSLKLTGATTSGNDIVLYRTQLTVSNGTPVVTVALKNGLAGTNASNLSVIVRKKDASSWIEVPCGDLTGKGWQEKTLGISGLAQGDVIEYIGLRVNGSTGDDYKMYVGKLKISDDYTVACPEINQESLLCEVVEESSDILSVKLAWEPNYSGYTTSIEKFGMVYNDEIDVDHFEILFKDQNGKVTEVGRTSQWATYIGKLPVSTTTEAYIGVRAVATDLLTHSKTEWVAIPHSTGTVPQTAVEGEYGKSFLFNYGSSTLESILSTIYWEKITTSGATTNIDYYASSNPVIGTPSESENYYYAQEHPLKVAQGQTVTINLKAKEAGSDCLKYDFVYLYLDFDGNYSFLDADETLGSVGTQNAGTAAIANPGVSFTFTVPADAVVGNSRLLIVGSDAWGAHPGPVGGTWKGHSIDFPVEITGTNPSRVPAETYKDRRDEGEAEEPFGYEDGKDLAGLGDVLVSTEESSVVVTNNVAEFTNTEKAWFYDVNGRCVKFVADATASANVSDLAKGVYLVKMQNNQIIRSVKVVVK